MKAASLYGAWTEGKCEPEQATSLRPRAIWIREVEMNKEIFSYLEPLIGHCFLEGWPVGGGGGSTLFHFPLAELPERRRKPFSPETIRHCT